MVSSIVPGAQGAVTNALSLDGRLSKTTARDGGANAEAGSSLYDSVSVGDAASWTAARESVSAGLDQLSAALSLGKDAQALLSKIETLAQNFSEDPAKAEGELKSALKSFAQRAREAVEQGAKLAAGEDVSVQAEPGSSPIEIEGLDLQLGEKAGGVFAFGSSASFGGDPSALLAAVQQSRDALQAGLQRLSDQANTLQTHQGFLGALAGATSGVRTDLDADTARLLALQVRQGLEGLSGASIANVEPQAVLNLFRV